MNDVLESRLERAQKWALGLGLVGVAFCALGAVVDAQQFFVSYLFGYLFWLGLPLGCLGALMLHHLTGGRWGFVIRRILEASLMTLPLMALLFVPILFGLGHLYPWADPQKVAASKILEHKHVYLNTEWFIIRAIVFFGIWILMAHLLRKWSLEQDGTTDPGPTRKLRKLSGPGAFIYPLTATFAYIDWVMSLEADWFSTMFGVIIVAGQALATFAFATFVLSLIRRSDPFSKVLTAKHFHYLGNILLTFVMFWTYVAFGQLLVIYAENLPQEIVWYLHRIAGGWKWVVVFLALYHFFFPFMLLLFRAVKRHVTALAALSVTILIAHFTDVFWMVQPTFSPTGIHVAWLDLAAPLGVGGLWVTVFLWQLRRNPILPAHDPRIEYEVADAG